MVFPHKATIEKVTQKWCSLGNIKPINRLAWICTALVCRREPVIHWCTFNEDENNSNNNSQDSSPELDGYSQDTRRIIVNDSLTKDRLDKGPEGLIYKKPFFLLFFPSLLVSFPFFLFDLIFRHFTI